MKKQNVLLSVYNDIRISTEPNKDETYKDYGIIHKCKAVAISKLSENFSDVANFLVVLVMMEKYLIKLEIYV